MLDEKLNPLADIAKNGKVENIFPTPLFWHQIKECEELNAQLGKMILEREANQTSPAKSNQGGWQSSTDLFNWGGTAVETLERYVRCALDVATVRITAPPVLRTTFEIFAWAAVNRAGHYNTVHVHPQATWSGVYYVDPGDEGDGSEGYLEFAHPVVAATMTFFPSILPSSRLVRPQPGMMILFPSYMLHSVRIYRGKKPRICVPFNAHLQNISVRSVGEGL